MKAIVLTDYGDVDKLELREVPEPTAKPGELKVKVAGSSINVIDVKIRRGYVKTFMPVQFPHILGNDTAGQVVEVGAGVSGFKVGDRVLGFVRPSYAEFVTAAAEAWAPVPSGLDVVDAAALPVVLLSGAQLIEEGAKVQAGDTVLVTGALGSVGRVALFVAKKLGAKVIAGVRGKQRAEAEKLGVDGVLAIDDAGEIERAARVDVLADTVGGETAARLVAIVKAGGRVASVLGEPAGAKERGLAVRGVVAHPDGKRLGALAESVARGELVVPIAGRYPFAHVREAHQAAERGSGGKIVLVA